MYLSYIEARDENVSKLRSYQNILNGLIDKLTNELGQEIKYKELSKRFWEVLPADIRNKYMNTIMSLREKIRLIYEQYPEFKEEWETNPKNINYYRSKKREEEKRVKELRERINKNIPQEEVAVEQPVTVGASMKKKKKKKPSAVQDYKRYWNQIKEIREKYGRIWLYRAYYME